MLNSNENEHNDEEIRPPDDIIRERLIDYNYSYNNDYDYDNIELEMAINESIKEQQEYEKKRLEMLEKTRLRVQTFKDVLFKIKKISMIDNKILKLYNIIEPIINSYCECKLDIYECDKDTYDTIFGTLKTIRLTESEYILFNNLFII
jgi:hypothetical protein